MCVQLGRILAREDLEVIRIKAKTLTRCYYFRYKINFSSLPAEGKFP